MLADTENQYFQSIRETVVHFDNSVVYTLNNVKYQEKGILSHEGAVKPDSKIVQTLLDAGTDGNVSGRGNVPVITFNDLKDSLKAQSDKKQEETEVTVQKTIHPSNVFLISIPKEIKLS